MGSRDSERTAILSRVPSLGCDVLAPRIPETRRPSERAARIEILARFPLAKLRGVTIADSESVGRNPEAAKIMGVKTPRHVESKLR